MRASAMAWVVTLLVGTVVFGCGDDDDGQIQPPLGGSSGAPRGDGGQKPAVVDAGPIDAGPLDAGMALDELGLPGDQLVSELTAEEAQQLCKKLDEATGLRKDLDRACLVEAYLITYDAAECKSIVSQCTDNGSTVLGLELELPCATKATEIAKCDASVNDVLACAFVLGDFYDQRKCAKDELNQPLPVCPKALTGVCPALFGPPGE